MSTSPNLLAPFGLALLLLTSLGGRAPAQEEAAAVGARTAEIDDLFEAWDRPDSPGAAVAVIDRGEVIHSAGYGIAQLEYDVEIGPDTIFHVASVSKQFTAMAAILLSVEGRLSLDDEARTHVPEIPDFGAPISLRHLLHHTSGLRDQWEMLIIAGWRLDDVITRDHILGIVERQRELNFAPGERHLYCNTGYTLLAEIVARVSGQSFPEFTRERIFEPLGMNATHFHDDHEHVVPDRAYSYHPAGDGFAKSVLSYANVGATSLFTTAEDLVRWLANFDHHRVGGPEAHAVICTRGVLNDGTELDYAGGILIGRSRGYETVSHGGGDAGFRSYVVWFPEPRLGIAVVSNLSSFPTASKANEIAKLLLPEQEELPAGAGATSDDERPAPEPEEGEPPVEVAEERLALYEGTYATPAGFALRVQRRSKRLYFRVGRTRRRMIPESETCFRTFTGDTRLRFTVADDAVAELELSSDGRRHRLSRCAEGVAPAVDLARFAGRYECPEVESLYSIELEEDRLFFRHLRLGRFALEPTWPDTFTSDRFYLRRLDFSRGEDGEIDGFRSRGGRVLDLRFERVADR